MIFGQFLPDFAQFNFEIKCSNCGFWIHSTDFDKVLIKISVVIVIFRRFSFNLSKSAESVWWLVVLFELFVLFGQLIVSYG